MRRHRKASRIALPLQTPRLKLRLPTLKDVPAWHDTLTEPRVLDLMLPEVPWTLGAVRQKVASAREGARNGTLYELAVERRSDGAVVGRVALKEVQLGPESRAILAYWMDPSVWGAGIASEAAHALCLAGFGQLPLHRIEAEVFAFNVRSQRLLRALGFRKEGEAREAIRYRGRWVSAWNFGLLRGELRSPPRILRRPSSSSGARARPARRP